MRALLCVALSLCSALAQDLRPGGEVPLATRTGLQGLASGFGSASDNCAVVKLAPLQAGKRYQLTLTYEAGTDIGYGHSWVDGDPFGKQSRSMVGIGTGTGSRSLSGKQEIFLFTIDPASSSQAIYLAFRTSKPWNATVRLGDPTGVTPDTKDRWGYFYVTDFDREKRAPFKLVAGPARIPTEPVSMAGPWKDVPVNGSATATTTPDQPNLATAFGSASDPRMVYRLGPLAPGTRYSVGLVYDGGSDVGFAHSWVDGNPFGRDWHSFVGIGSGTGSRPMVGKTDVFQFTVAPGSTSRYVFLVMRTGKPMPVKVNLQTGNLGLTTESKDRWGYFYVTDFDKDRTAPFLLKR